EIDGSDRRTDVKGGDSRRRACGALHGTSGQTVVRDLEEFFMQPYVVGIVLSIGVAVFARWVGFDRERAFYPTVLIVIASYYVLFAAMIGSLQTVLSE